MLGVPWWAYGITAGILGIGAVLWFRAKLRRAEEDRIRADAFEAAKRGDIAAQKAEEKARDAANSVSDPTNFDRW